MLTNDFATTLPCNQNWLFCNLWCKIGVIWTRIMYLKSTNRTLKGEYTSDKRGTVQPCRPRGCKTARPSNSQTTEGFALLTYMVLCWNMLWLIQKPNPFHKQNDYDPCLVAFSKDEKMLSTDRPLRPVKKPRHITQEI